MGWALEEEPEKEMDSLFSKLTNLAYEFFGILLPGSIAAIYILVFWMSLGQLIEVWSAGYLSTLTLSSLGEWNATGFSGTVRIGMAITFAYFLGHSLNWVSRRPRASDAASASSAATMWSVLTLRLPRPEKSYHEDLEPLLTATSKHLSPAEGVFTWRQFYPVAKVMINQRLSYSLVASYQYKYTLHRAIAMASALLFWAGMAGILGAIVSTALFHRVESPIWPLLGALPLLALALASGFAGSYLYSWKLFGDAVITESYFLTNVAPNFIEPKK
jgi:hypothetical protein